MYYKDYLFKDEEILKANEYLTNKFSTNGKIKFVSLSEMISNLKPPAEFISKMINELYGINQPQMANFYKVQEFVDSFVMDRLINHLKSINANFQVIDFIPGSIVAEYIFYKMSKGDVAPMEHWCPSEKWNFNEIQAPEKELSNPTNGFVHIELILKNINNPNFIKRLARNGLLDNNTNINETIPEIRLKLLPYNHYNKVLNIADVIFGEL